MKQSLINHFSKSNSSPMFIIKGEIECAKEEYIVLAYKAMLDGASNKKIIYLLGGNNPSKCPF